MKAFVGACCAAVALVLVAPAGSAIVVQKSIAGITLSVTKAQVKAKLGTPKSVKTGSNDFGAYTIYVYTRVRVTFQSGNAATAVETTSPLERTAAGVGVGSTLAAVNAKVAGVKCELIPGAGHCYVGSFRPGRRVTDFFIRQGKVSRVVVGFVID